MRLKHLIVYLMLLLVTGCEFRAVNSPYPDQEQELSTLFTSFSLRPKHLDPARFVTVSGDSDHVRSESPERPAVRGVREPEQPQVEDSDLVVPGNRRGEVTEL